MGNNGFPIGLIIVGGAVWCIIGIIDSKRPEQVRAFGLGLLGAFLAFGALLIAVAID